MNARGPPGHRLPMNEGKRKDKVLNVEFRKVDVRSAVNRIVGGRTLSVGILCKGDIGWMKSKSSGFCGSP